MADFTSLIATGNIQFKPATIVDLDSWGRQVVSTYLTRPPITFQLGNIKIGTAYCLKIDDPYLQFLDIRPDTCEFEWWTSNHTQDLWPDDATVYLLGKLGIKAEMQQVVHGMELWRIVRNPELN